MVIVKVTKKKKQYRKIDFIGHAEFANPGKDIVCSGISSVVTTSVNAILQFNDEWITYSQSKDKFSVIVKECNDIVNNLITNMLNMLKDIEQTYPKNIKIEEEDL